MTTWVYLRGLTREARHWGDFSQQFLAEFAGNLTESDILTPDLPGNGLRFREPSPTRIGAMMEACRAELLGQGQRPPYHLLALSLGGMVAVEWALRHPEECQALVLMSTSLRTYCPIQERLQLGAWPTLLQLFLAEPERRERAILRMTSARADELDWLLPNWTAWNRECPVSPANTLRQLYAAARYSPAGRPSAPVLILAGAQDRIVKPACSRRIAQAWGARFALHPSAGHDLPLDDGHWVASEVKGWLAVEENPATGDAGFLQLRPMR